MSKISYNGPRKVVLARGNAEQEGCFGLRQHRVPIQPSEGHYDLTEDI
jgi:hypothetical protein